MKNRRGLIISLVIIGLIIIGGGTYLIIKNNKNIHNYTPANSTNSKKEMIEPTLCTWNNDDYKILVKELEKERFGISKVQLEIKDKNNVLLTTETFPGYLCPKFSNGNKVYLEHIFYEQEGKLFLLDLDSTDHNIIDLSIDNFGALTPDNKYYIHVADTTKKDGTPICTNAVLNGIVSPKAAIWALDLLTAESVLQIENKSKYFKIVSVTNDDINYTQQDINENITHEGCPETTNQVDGTIKINKNTAEQIDIIACSEEALQCPDGSFVGRTGPNCQFVCPKIPNQDNDKYVECGNIKCPASKYCNSFLTSDGTTVNLCEDEMKIY